MAWDLIILGGIAVLALVSSARERMRENDEREKERIRRRLGYYWERE